MPVILSIVPYKIFPAKVGGQKGIALFNEYLAKETTLICVTVQSNDPAYAKGYTVLNVLSDSSFRYINLLYFFTILKYKRQYKATHLLLEHPYYGWLGILLKWFTGIKLIIHSHNLESARWKSLGKWWWKILWRYEGITHRAADYSFFIQHEDRASAIQQYRLDAKKCIAITYGIEWDSSPAETERARCRNYLIQQHQIAADKRIFLFNGALDYQPNLDAAINILEKINPLLLSFRFSYAIVICGRGLPAAMNELKAYQDKNIVYAGFVEDIAVYFKGADIFINPIVDGGGIKTKLVEALGYNTSAISTQNGSVGISVAEAGRQLTIVPDGDWPGFANAAKHTRKLLFEILLG
jgi:polysaccharide biosynthesis protein PslH